MQIEKLYPPMGTDSYPNRNEISSFSKSFANNFKPSKLNIRTAWAAQNVNGVKENNAVLPYSSRNKEIDVEQESKWWKKINVCKSLAVHIEEYFIHSSLHGLRYIGDKTISLGERFFWFLAFLISFSLAIYFITSIYTKYDKNPVIISLNPKPTPISELPFPAITICSMNQAKRSEADAIIESGSEVEQMLLDDYCNSNNSFSNITTVSDEGTKWDNVLKFILRVNPSCQEILKVCLWRQEEMPCEDLFNSALTDDGLCCTFNALPGSFIFKNAREMAGLNLTFPPQVDDWNPENGYSENSSINALPWRASGAGTHLGLTIVLDAQLDAYYCSSSVGVGFKMLLHNPLETPKMADFALLLAAGLEARVIVRPKIYDATQSIRSINIQKRICYFTNERDLQFYRTYTELNCKLECQANYTLSLCGCVPFYLPKNRYKKICSKRKEACTSIAKEVMEIPNQDGLNCNCLPACFELGFDATITFAKLSNKFRIKEQLLKNESIDYFQENMVLVHFFFTESQFTRNTKSELYGFSEFLSNTGGLLGLFLGFSALSVVELLYFLTLKAFCNAIRSHKKSKKTKKKKIIKDKVAKSLYPFRK